MTDELQQARDDAMYACEMAAAAWVRASLLADREGATTLQMDFNRAVKDYAEVATREYREALDRGRLALVDAAQALDYAARHIDRQAMGAMEKAREKALVAASALLPQPVPTQEVGE